MNGGKFEMGHQYQLVQKNLFLWPFIYHNNVREKDNETELN